MRKSWVQVNGELIPKEEYYGSKEQYVMIMPDIKPYKSMITGEEISSRSKHRNHLRQHNCIEIGNEKFKPKEKPLPSGLKEEIIRNYQKYR